MKSVYLFYAFALLSLFSCSERKNPLLTRLDETLTMKDDYESYFLDRLDVLKHVLAEQEDPEQLYNLNKRIADEYKAFSLDSTMVYLNKNSKIALEMNDRHKKIETDILTALEYAMTGYLVEASDLLAAYNEVEIPQDLKYDYYNAYHVLSGEMMAYTNSSDSYREKRANRDRYRDILLGITPEDTVPWYHLKIEEASKNGDLDKAREYAWKMMEMTNVNTHEYAKACYYYQNTFPDDSPEKIEWLVRSSIADIMCATKDYASLNTLAHLLFERGDIDRAFKYTADHCMRDAIFFNGKLRPWQVSQFFPEIEKAYQEKSMRSRKVMFWMIIAVSLLSFFLIVLLSVIFRRQQMLESVRKKLSESYVQIEDRNHELQAINSKLSSLNRQLQEADKIKQEYIALFLSMMSENINTTRQYKNHVLKYIRHGKTEELVEEIGNLPPLEEDIAEFYKMFDRTFINLFPDFVDKFNELLDEDSVIVPKGNDILTPEMRIFALIKLGINDSSKIASLLHYSANTIYNYRAKIKNRSRIERDSFEDAVKAL